MNRNATQVPDAVRSMIDRSTQRLAADDDLHQPLPTSTGRIPAQMSPTSRKAPRILAAAACAAALIGALAVVEHRSSTPTERRASTGVSPAPTDPSPSTSTSRPADYYDRAMADNEGPIVLPATEPPDVEWVWLRTIRAGDGPFMEDMVVEHGDSGVRVCAATICPNTQDELLRTFEVDGVTFNMFHVPTKNALDTKAIAPLAPAVAAYWKSATFTSERPSWLVAAMEPGSLPPG